MSISREKNGGDLPASQEVYLLSQIRGQKGKPVPVLDYFKKIGGEGKGRAGLERRGRR